MILKKINWVIILLAIVFAAAIGCGKLLATEHAYALKFDLKNFPEEFGAILDQFDVSTNELISSTKVNEEVNVLTLLNNGDLLFSLTMDGDCPGDKIQKYRPLSKKSISIIKTEGLSPVEIIPAQNKYFVELISIKKTKELIQKEPNKALYDYGGIEIYSQKKPYKHIKTIRLGRTDMVEDIIVDEDKTRIYVMVYPLDVEDKEFPRGYRYNHLNLSYIYVIDTLKDEIVETIDLEPYLRTGTSLCVIDNYLIVGAMNTTEYDGELAGEYYREELDKIRNPNKPRVRGQYKEVTFKQSATNQLYVFSLNPFKFVENIEADYSVGEMVYVKEDNRLFTQNKAPLGNLQGRITVINWGTKKIEKKMKIHGLNMMSYVGNHKLYLSSREKLIILNTQTLEIEKEYPGYYAPISKEY